MADPKKNKPSFSKMSEYFSPSGTAIPQAALDAAGSSPLVSWTTPQNVTQLVSNPRVQPKKEPATRTTPFLSPRAKLVAVFKKHGIDSPYALEQIQNNPTALGALLGELAVAGVDSETSRFVLPATAKMTPDGETFNALLSQNPQETLNARLFGKAKEYTAEEQPWMGVLTRPTAIDPSRADFNPAEAEAAQKELRSMVSATRSFFDEARTGKTQAYRPVSVVSGWTGGGGVPVEQTKAWDYEPFEPDYGD